LWKRKKPHGAKSGKYGSWGTVGVPVMKTLTGSLCKGSEQNNFVAAVRGLKQNNVLLNLPFTDEM
jgi:hypothetical protein